MQTHAFEQTVSACRCRNCAARKAGFCSVLDAGSVGMFSAHSRRMIYPQDTEIVAQGEHFDRVGVIARGLIKLQSISENGAEHVLEVFRAGQVIGADGDAPSRFTLQAVSEAEVCWMTHSAWSDFLSASPQHFQSYMNIAQHHIENMQIFLANMRGRNTLQRVAFWLIEERNHVAGAALHIRLSRRDLASLLDMTVETLCRSLRHLQDAGAIRLPKPDLVEITDTAMLCQIAGCHADSACEQSPPLPAAGGWQRASRTWTSGVETAAEALPAVQPRRRPLRGG